ncbi:MAG: hypothetical protein JO152_11520 [Mycobacteriaceae bacterium]|nr:hypothetical protein [Mycobacteriaceae bacterium]
MTDPTSADDVGPDDTLSPTESLDADDVRHKDGDVVVDPPDHWYAADKDTAEPETLDEKLAAEQPPDTPEDGDSLFPIVE